MLQHRKMAGDSQSAVSNFSTIHRPRKAPHPGDRWESLLLTLALPQTYPGALRAQDFFQVHGMAE